MLRLFVEHCRLQWVWLFNPQASRKIEIVWIKYFASLDFWTIFIFGRNFINLVWYSLISVKVKIINYFILSFAKKLIEQNLYIKTKAWQGRPRWNQTLTRLARNLCKEKLYIYIFVYICDTWQVSYDRWQVACDTWQATRDMWHVTCGGGWTFSHKFSSLALTVLE